MAVRFSNDHRSLATSLGLFRTAETYRGANGYSLRMDGLEPGFNDRARERAIVMHGAPYVSEAFAKAHGRLGRSWGCPALSAGVAQEVIDTIRGGSLVFAYGPDPRWPQPRDPPLPPAPAPSLKAPAGSWTGRRSRRAGRASTGPRSSR